MPRGLPLPPGSDPLHSRTSAFLPGLGSPPPPLPACLLAPPEEHSGARAKVSPPPCTSLRGCYRRTGPSRDKPSRTAGRWTAELHMLRGRGGGGGRERRERETEAGVSV
ncbi:Hypothetical predicted protein [Scomber scombrus]|uniref:Uncharacterized protein n=1 Tax=Scomber scombrus TaxID=13677 RepID=A0AAV1QF44_SCOSC